MKKNTDYDGEIFLLNDKYLLLSDLMTITKDTKIELDLGCGTGDLALGLAERYPDRLIFAADIQLSRIRKVAKKGKRGGMDNLRCFRVEARHLMSIILPDQCLDRLHILCPDPWPKARHSGHRLMSADFMEQIRRVLKDDGTFHFATDDEPYMTATVKNLKESGLFEQISSEPPEDIADIKTEFERQWLAQGKTVPHTVWRKTQKF